MNIQWYVVYYNDPDNDHPVQGMPDHTDRTIKFCFRDMGKEDHQKFYVAGKYGWRKTTVEYAEERRPFVTKETIRKSFNKRFIK